MGAAGQKTFTIDSGQSANLQYDGNDGTGIVYGSIGSHDLDTGVNFTGSAWIIADVGGANEGIFFRAGVKNTFIKVATTGGDNTGVLQISSSNFSIGSQGAVTASGKITAPEGQIATFHIASASIDSNPNNFKRGLKLEPGNSIRGYGTSAHNTTSIPGKFSFGVGASIAPARGARIRFSADFIGQPGNIPT